MSLADQVLAVNDDLPIRTDKPVHSGNEAAHEKREKAQHDKCENQQ
ncbi:hypothetical protein [Photobacterium leiognathi]|nr:hypothetical protein [Photobacterium leiognathi]